jgi:hypothetical protein
MASALLSRHVLYSSVPIGVGIGLSLSTPFLSSTATAIQCQYNAPYSRTVTGPESGREIRANADGMAVGRTSPSSPRGVNNSKFLTARTMRQASLGSLLGLAVGLGLRIVSKALVFVLGVGIVLIEVFLSPHPHLCPHNTAMRGILIYNL